MSSYTYVDTPNANLVCCICRSPFVEPCITRTCCHTFCYECISQAVTINRQCPIDRTPLTIHDLAPADPVVRNLVDELVVKCPQEPLGCSYLCQRLLMPVHLRDSCQYVEFACPEAKCSQRILRKDLQTHQCHGNNSQSSGAGVQQPRDAQGDRRQANHEEPTSATEASQQESQSPSADLAAENAILRLRLSALENVVHTLRSEMFAVKHALGPWFRPELQLQLHPEPNADQSSVATPLEVAEHTPLDNIEVRDNASSTEPSPPPPATVGDGSDISSYFPAPEELTSEAPSRPRRSRAVTDAQRPYLAPVNARSQSTASPTTSYPGVRTNVAPGSAQSVMYSSSSYPTPGPMPGMSYPQSNPLPTPSPATVSIPPLDPSTPLPDTLKSLHSSLVTLAGALGALAAARGSDSLRTTEELRGLRGAMHALRMQVHDILTSRTHLPSQGPGAAAGGAGEGDTADGPALGLGAPSWIGYGPRPYGYPAMYAHPFPPPYLGVPHPPPTNITKL
ncbi:hypothetical protein PYCCODRAFT_1364965 [Trametes coccinea BRFM310]|uniref:RING-type domain-containing protein n=1 Tax=Trametes coccinea (strain BRFM310) TaxID=1353009 RepID=A0A1Y2IVT9_TRAC3|nr:hypothetical protein PYCCODRAFT_1364965 [Trametes coccinea BRFM310]